MASAVPQPMARCACSARVHSGGAGAKQSGEPVRRAIAPVGLPRALRARLECLAQGRHGVLQLKRRWLVIASLFRQTLLFLKRAPPRSGAAASYFTRADSGDWAQGHERAKSTYPDKPTRLCRAGAQPIRGRLFFLAAEAAFYRRGNCTEFFSEAHRSHASWILSVSSWSCCLPAPVATKLGLLPLISASPLVSSSDEATEKKTPTCDQLCFDGHRSRRPRIVLDIRGRANFSSSFQAYLDPYSQLLIGQEKCHLPSSPSNLITVSPSS